MLKIKGSSRIFLYMLVGGFLGDSVAKNLPANTGAAEDVSSIPGSGRFPGGRNENSLQDFCLGNPMDREVW